MTAVTAQTLMTNVNMMTIPVPLCYSITMSEGTYLEGINVISWLPFTPSNRLPVCSCITLCQLPLTTDSTHIECIYIMFIISHAYEQLIHRISF